MVSLTDDPLDLSALLTWVRTDADGAIVSFLGVVRDFSEGRRVTSMEYHGYRELALRELAALEEETLNRFPVTRVALVHRLGDLGLGEASVAVVVAAPHRAEAFDACRYAIDTLKRTLPIWKKEQFADETTAWVSGVPGRSVQEVDVKAEETSPVPEEPA